MNKQFLTVDEVAADMRSGGFHISGQAIREQARTDPRLLGFSVSVIGNKVIIPTASYESWKSGSEHKEAQA